MDVGQVGGFILDRLDFVWGLIIGLTGSLVSWRQKQVELKSKLYYPLFIACYDLLLIFDEIGILKDDEERGTELYEAAAKNLDNIMNSYGTTVNLRSEPNNPERDYLRMFFQVKRTIDLNRNSINSNWPEATIWFENGKETRYSGSDPGRLAKIKEFEDLRNRLLKLRRLCEEKGKALKGREL